MEKDNQKNKYQDYFKNDELNEDRYFADSVASNDSSNNNPSDDKNTFNKMDKERKTALFVLGFFAIFIIVIWFINFNSSLKDPFAYKGDIPAESQFSGNLNDDCVGPNCPNDNLNPDNLDLKLIDTDGDGISDWDELFIYGTSPYLADTDGDGLTDYEEIFVYGTDPLCPEGQDCGNSLTGPDSQAVTPGSDNFYNFLSGLDGEESSFVGGIGSENLPSELQPGQMNVESLREMLIESGFNQEDLDQISDADLLEAYNEVLLSF